MAVVGQLCRAFAYLVRGENGQQLGPKWIADLPLTLCIQHAIARVTGQQVFIHAGVNLFHDLREQGWEPIDWDDQEMLFDVSCIKWREDPVLSMVEMVGSKTEKNLVFAESEIRFHNRAGISLGRKTLSRSEIKESLKARDYQRFLRQTPLWVVLDEQPEMAIDLVACLMPSRLTAIGKQWELPQPPGCVIVPENQILTFCVYVPDDYTTAIASGFVRQMLRVQCQDGGWCETFSRWFEYQVRAGRFAQDCGWRQWNRDLLGHCDHPEMEG